MNLTDWALALATCVILIISVFTDVRYGRIYNTVTVPFAALGIVIHTVDGGLAGLGQSLGGLGLGLALFFISALVGRILGAGDCKLLAAVGALQGPQFILWAILYTLLAGGALALVVALWRGILGPSLDRVWRAAYMRIAMKVPMDIEQSDQRARLPYAIAISAGVLYMLYQSGPQLLH
jgi:prepilin peptidase CpaA